jgi:hypothetical protein
MGPAIAAKVGLLSNPYVVRTVMHDGVLNADNEAAARSLSLLVEDEGTAMIYFPTVTLNINAICLPNVILKSLRN